MRSCRTYGAYESWAACTTPRDGGVLGWRAAGRTLCPCSWKETSRRIYDSDTLSILEVLARDTEECPKKTDMKPCFLESAPLRGPDIRTSFPRFAWGTKWKRGTNKGGRRWKNERRWRGMFLPQLRLQFPRFTDEVVPDGVTALWKHKHTTRAVRTCVYTALNSHCNNRALITDIATDAPSPHRRR